MPHGFNNVLQEALDRANSREFIANLVIQRSDLIIQEQRDYFDNIIREQSKNIQQQQIQNQQQFHNFQTQIQDLKTQIHDLRKEIQDLRKEIQDLKK